MSTAAAAAIMPPILLDEREAARALGLTPRTLSEWRRTGNPQLPYVKMSTRCIRYRLSDLEKFAAARLRTSTSDPGPEK